MKGNVRMRVNFKVAQNCPLCRSQNIMITDVCVLFDDTRMETVECCDCSTAWKLYYKVADCFAEILEKHECKCKQEGSECQCEDKCESEPKVGIPVNKNIPQRPSPAQHVHSASCNHAAVQSMHDHTCEQHTNTKKK